MVITKFPKFLAIFGIVGWILAMIFDWPSGTTTWVIITYSAIIMMTVERVGQQVISAMRAERNRL